jgi:drug/metabolite transporter (DMT)-like permease
VNGIGQRAKPALKLCGTRKFVREISRLTHSYAAYAMAFAAVLVSTGGVVAKQLTWATGFEAAFIRSATAAAILLFVGSWMYGLKGLVDKTRAGGWLLVASATCWAVMLTAFMVAVTMTTVANVLVVLAIDPLLTTLAARATLGSRVPAKTWFATAGACAGVLTMFGGDVNTDALLGTAIAFLVPLAAAANWTLSQYIQQSKSKIDLLPALLYGTALSAAFSFTLTGALESSSRDVALLIGLGVFQCAVPCTIAVVCARTLKAPELALLALLELVCGTALVWMAGVEPASWRKVGGAGLVLLSVLLHEVWTPLTLRCRQPRLR